MKRLRPRAASLLNSVRKSMRVERAAREQAAFERRAEVRRLLFSKGGGNMKHLTEKEKDLVRSVREEAYQAYLHLFRTGISRYHTRKYGPEKKSWIRVKTEGRLPVSRAKYRVLWYGSQKARWLRFDLPRRLKLTVGQTMEAAFDTPSVLYERMRRG